MQVGNVRKRKISIFKPFKSIALNPFNPSTMQPMMIAAPSRRTGSKRPVDKLLINVTHQSIDATQQNTVLTTATFPCTVVGLRWDISVAASAGTAHASYAWAIIILRDGVTVGALSIGDGTTFYAPEQDVLVYGRGFSTDESIQGGSNRYQGDTKTMRKLMGGDKLQFISKGEATNTSNIEGCIQFFCKT